MAILIPGRNTDQNTQGITLWKSSCIFLWKSIIKQHVCIYIHSTHSWWEMVIINFGKLLFQEENSPWLCDKPQGSTSIVKCRENYKVYSQVYRNLKTGFIALKTGQAHSFKIFQDFFYLMSFLRLKFNTF